MQQPLPHAGSGTSKKLAKRNAAAKMLLRVHTVPLDARDGTEAEPDDDHFSIVSGPWGRAAAGGLGPAHGDEPPRGPLPVLLLGPRCWAESEEGCGAPAGPG